MPIALKRFDHLVLTVADLQKTRDFYTAVLGMAAEEFQPGRWALKFGQQKINLHPAAHVPDPNVRHATPGSADLCLLTDTPVAEVLAWLAHHHVPVVTGPIRRSGALGPLLSVYVYDPDENLIEIAHQLPA
ncbi:VOC family protein [Hymenobacter nivis]|uniref:VOC family protein n=1 Tax=Hymenobacter nivis TaxID=1850093 RepID=A0A502HBF9_9BACT|nr:VOC family protein [Hymenobacter nivis]TPG71841.1 VOC family protein [Hymenobacter nivis]